MGFGSVLGAIGKGILHNIPIIGGIAEAASALGSGRARGRAAEDVTNSNYDRNRLLAAQQLENALQGRANLDLRQRQFALDAPGQRASNSVRGDVLSGVQDAQVMGPVTGTHGQVPTITGGLRPSLLSAGTRQLGQSMSRDALLRQMQGDAFDPLPPVTSPTITPPTQAGAFDKILGGIGTVGGLLSAGGGLFDDENSLRHKYGTRPSSHGPYATPPFVEEDM